MGEKRNLTLRYLGVLAVFCVVCVVYLGRLFYIQISGRDAAYQAGQTEVKTVQIQALRGEIYDRNGKKLVGNRYSYDLVLGVEFLKLDAQKKTQVCNELLETLQDCSAVRPETYFPFEGSYPYYSYSDGAQSSATHQAVLSRIGLDADATATEVAEYYRDTYLLEEKDDEGSALYSYFEKDALLRMFYDMDARKFYYNGEYVVATGLELSTDGSTNLMTSVLEKTLATVSFKYRMERVYYYPGYATHILGSVGPIFAEEWEDYNKDGYQMDALVGKDGCEAAFEEHLRGIDGLVKVEKTASGVQLTTLREARAGRDVYLTIDIDLQIAAEDALRENVEFVSGRTESASEGALCDAGAAVVMDPETFEVLAIASYPTYDLGTFNENYELLRDDPAEPLRNRALKETYAPGSTLKIGMALAGIDAGLVGASETMRCTGLYNGLECSNHNPGMLDAVDALTYSCNSYFYEIGDRFYNSLESPLLERYLSALGLGERTGLELSEEEGVLAGPTHRGEGNTTESWTRPISWMAAIGQADHRMSPIQLASYIGTVYNNGTRLETRLLHSVHAFGSSEVLVYGESEVLSQTAFSEEALDTVYEGMYSMVQNTAVVSNNLGLASLPDNVTVGGKTGTAQVGGDNPDNALFVCGAEVDGQADLVIAVVLEAGAHGYHASRTAGAVLDAYYNVDE